MKAAITSAIALAILTACLTGCAGQPPAAPTATATNAPAPLATPSTSPAAEPPPSAPTATAAISDEDRAAISAGISSGMATSLTPYLADPTTVILCGSGGIGPLSPEEVVNDLDPRLEAAAVPWDFALPATTITDYQARAYGSYFPPDALVARSADTQVLAFSFTGAQISTVFLCPNEALVLE